MSCFLLLDALRWIVGAKSVKSGLLLANKSRRLVEVKFKANCTSVMTVKKPY